MNYFAHGVRFIDRPWFLAGTALPDWMSVADRQTRLRARRVEPFADHSGSPHAELAAGIMQHLHDDDWFHNTQAFHEVTAELTRLFRDLLPQDDGHRPSFLGHIVTELLLDVVLITRNPSTLAGYYTALESLDVQIIQSAVNQMVKNPTERLVIFFPLFCRERFLGDYLQADRLLYRLNQVLRRVKLSPLPAETIAVLDAAREIVEKNAAALLPDFAPEDFTTETRRHRDEK